MSVVGKDNESLGDRGHTWVGQVTTAVRSALTGAEMLCCPSASSVP